MRLEDDGTDTVCHETIYRYVYGPAGRANALYRLLLSRRRRRRARYARKPKGLYIPEENTIRRCAPVTSASPTKIPAYPPAVPAAVQVPSAAHLPCRNRENQIAADFVNGLVRSVAFRI
jgi:hypothetical protein